MLGVKIAAIAVAFCSQKSGPKSLKSSSDQCFVGMTYKTLVRTAFQAFGNTFLSTKGNGNRCDLHEKLFINIGT